MVRPARSNWAPDYRRGSLGFRLATSRQWQQARPLVLERFTLGACRASIRGSESG